MPFGGGGGTQTTVTNSTPFNANELNNINNRALGLLDNNPLNYYGGQTYYGSDPRTDLALSSGLNYNLDAANKLGGSMAGLQGTAQYRNNEYANGKAYNDISGLNDQLVNTAIHPSNMGMEQLWGIGGGNYRPDQFSNSLFGMGSANATGNAQGQLNSVGSGDYYRMLMGGPGGTLSNISNGSLMAGANPIMSGYQNAMYAPGADAARAQAGGYGLGQGQLSATAGGSYLGSNPFLDSVFKQGAGQVTDAYQTAVDPGIKGRMAADGRFGSGAYQNAEGQAQKNLGNTLSGLASSIYAPAYESERNRQLQSAQALGTEQTNNAQTLAQIYQNALQGQGSLYGQLSGIGADAASNLGNLMNNATGQITNAANASGNLALGNQNSNIQALLGGGQLFNQGVQNMTDAAKSSGYLGVQQQQLAQQGIQSAIGNRLTADNTQRQAALSDADLAQLANTDYQNAIKYGSGMQQLGQQGLNDQMQRFYGQQESPWQTLQRASGIISGSNGPGSQSVTQPVAGTNPLSAILGGLGGANALFGSGGILGTGAAGSSGLLALLGLSDRRLKSDIKRVGTLDNGLPVYAYRLLGGPPQIGLMADEVEKVNPNAVVTDDQGIKRVFYHLAVMNNEDQ